METAKAVSMTLSLPENFTNKVGRLAAEEDLKTLHIKEEVRGKNNSLKEKEYTLTSALWEKMEK